MDAFGIITIIVKSQELPSQMIRIWESKIERNVERDHINTTRLKIEGWNVRIIWECETENQELLKSIITEIMSSVTYS